MQNTVTPYKRENETKKDQVADMFNNISGTYDFLNHFMSMGIDKIWRKMAIGELKKDRPKLILDVASGTGDFAFEAMRILKPEKIIGVDIAQKMLEIANKKALKKGLQNQYETRVADSENLPFADHSFDALTVAYGVRNFENLEKGLAEMLRVLKPGSKIVILEFSKPKYFPVKQLYNFYFHSVTPAIGKLFSKDARAYNYLPESVTAFPDGADFVSMMKKAGYADTKCRPLAFGICSIYTGRKE